MAAKMTSKHEITPSQIDEVCQRIARNLRVRRTLPGKGRLHIDRQLPFLCIYRQPPDSVDAGTERLVKGEASYLIAPGAARYRQGIANLVRQVVATLSAQFGAFLIVEVWAASSAARPTIRRSRRCCRPSPSTRRRRPR